MNRIEKLLQLLQEMPTDSFLKFALGLEYLKINEQQKALHYFENIVAEDENYSGVYYHLGKLYEQQGDEKKATDTYEAGMLICKKLNETHNYNELRGAIDALM